VLLLDEPLSALDKKLREQTQFELVNIQEQVGITFVMVTHDQEEAMTMSSRIAVMDHGRIIQVGKPNEIYEFPANRFVAGFIGSVNLFDGRLIEDHGDHAVIASDEAGGTFVIGHGIGTHVGSLAVGSPVCLAVRPEKIRLAREGDCGTPNELGGRVKDIAYVGDSCIYHVVLDSGKLLRVTAPNLSRWADQPFARDDVVRVGWAADAGVIVE
jgi:putrescine transport system ATP-binding protein